MLIRLDKFLSDVNYGSRKVVKEIIRLGKVQVDEKTITIPEYKVDTDNNKVVVNGITVKYEKYRYVMLNKPAGVISATEDKKFMEKTVIDILDEKFKHYNLFPVGRLDRDTVGLLILTNDGKFAHNTLSPKKHVSKTYYAEISGKVTPDDVSIFKKGVLLKDGYTCKSADLEILVSDYISKVHITIREGKYHQIKKMFISVDKEVAYLKRINFGGIALDESLKEGSARELNEEELKIISCQITH